MDKMVFDNRKEIAEICENLGVKRLDVLGPSTDCLHETGMRDVDFLVEFNDPRAHLGGLRSPYFDLIESLQDLFGGQADHVLVAVESDVDDPYLKRLVEMSRETLYATRRDFSDRENE